MTDINQIQNLFENTDLYNALKHEFTSLERAFVPDVNNRAYGSGYIQLDLSSLRDSFVNYAEAELWIPLTITSAAFTGPMTGSKNCPTVPTTAGVACDLIRWKGSQLALFGDLVVKNNTDSVIKESSTYYRNIAPEPLNHSEQWYKSGDSSRISYSFDDASNNVWTSTGPGLAQVGWGVPDIAFSASATTAADGIMFPGAPYRIRANTGIVKGMNDFFSQFQYNSASHSYYGNVTIKLRELSPFFEQLDFPMSANFTLYIYFNFINGSNAVKNMPPLQCLSGVGVGTTVTAGTAFNLPAALGTFPSITIGGTLNADTACRLYYKSIKFNSEMGRKILAAYQHNQVKYISFNTTEVFDSYQNVTNDNNQTILINPLLKRIQRLYMLGYDHANPLNSWTSNGCGFIDANIVDLNNFNVKINNKNYYQENLTLDNEFYDEALQCTSTYGLSDESHSLLNEDTYYNGNTLYVFDLKRLETRMDPESSVSIYVEFTNQYDGAVDYVFLTERLVRFRITMTDKGATFVEL